MRTGLMLVWAGCVVACAADAEGDSDGAGETSTGAATGQTDSAGTGAGPGMTAGSGAQTSGSATGPTGSGGDASTGTPAGEVRINQIQAKGTHNSYHVPSAFPLPVWDYTMAPLSEQFGDFGVRQIELDVHWDPNQGFVVHHVPLDTGTTCELLVDCVSEVETWSVANPEHHVVFIFIEPKDELDLDKISGHFGDLEDELASAWPSDRTLTPDAVRGDHPDLLTALQADGWPTVDETRGMAMFVMLDTGGHRDEYLDGDDSLAGRTMFVLAGLDDPFSGVMKADHPVNDADTIAAAIDGGLIVRTRADANVVEPAANDTTRMMAALDSGAQIISTDFPTPGPDNDYHLEIPGGTPSRCNPINGPAGCESGDIE